MENREKCIKIFREWLSLLRLVSRRIPCNFHPFVINCYFFGFIGTWHLTKKSEYKIKLVIFSKLYKFPGLNDCIKQHGGWTDVNGVISYWTTQALSLNIVFLPKYIDILTFNSDVQIQIRNNACTQYFNVFLYVVQKKNPNDLWFLFHKYFKIDFRTWTYSTEPIKPYSSAPQEQNIILRLGRNPN